MTRSSRPRWRRSTAIGATAALVVGALASIAAAVSPSGVPASASQYAKKVTICHHTHSKKHPVVTITVSRNALPAHLRHGDTVGPCPVAMKATKASHAKRAKHAKKSEKGNRSAERSHGHSGLAPRHGASSRGHSGSTPGHSGSAPGHSANQPAHVTRAPTQPKPPEHAVEPDRQPARLRRHSARSQRQRTRS